MDGDGRALPRPRDARRRARHEDRAWRSATTTRARSAPTGSSTRSPLRDALRRRRACASTSAPRPPSTSSPREGEYLGGVAHDRHRDLAGGARPSAARALPKVDLAPPRSVIGKNTIDAIRSGVVFGYAGAVDAILRRLYDELGERADGDRHRRPGRPGRAVTRGDRRGRRPAHAHRAAPAARAQHLERASHERRGCMTRPRPIPGRSAALRVPNRVLLAPLAGIGNWFVRLQAKRYGAGHGRLGDGLQHAIHHGNEKTLHRDAAHRPARARRAGRSRSSCSARTRTSCARPPPTSRARGADADRPQHGLPGPEGLQDRRRRRAARRPRPRGRRRARRRARAAGLPVTVKLRSGLRAGRARAASSWPTASSTRPASRRSRFHPRSAAVHHKGAPDYDARRAAGRDARRRR